MPFVFNVKNKRRLLSYQEVLKVGDLLRLTPNLSQYSFENEAENFQLMTTKLSELHDLWLGVEGKSSMGFLLSYDGKANAYQVDLSLYATRVDWKITLSFLSELSKAIGNPIQFMNQKYSSSEIVSLSSDSFIASGVENLLNRLKDSKLLVYGIKRPILFGKNVEKNLLNTGDKSRLLGDIIYLTQYPSAYVHQQTFHYNDGGKTIYGNYSIGENMKGVLPLEPFVEEKNTGHLVGHPLTHWTLTVSTLNEDQDYKMYKVCEYYSFIQHIPRDKMTYLDDNFVLVDKLSKQELEDIINKAKELDKYGQFLEEEQ